ncbi:serine protease 41 [Pseudorca crassidens]|uniref:serine protease 41 n=1 Tax=Pseudorca crassidens TaxID=82174 RepID=UPI00352EA4C6
MGGSQVPRVADKKGIVWGAPQPRLGAGGSRRGARRREEEAVGAQVRTLLLAQLLVRVEIARQALRDRDLLLPGKTSRGPAYLRRAPEPEREWRLIFSSSRPRFLELFYARMAMWPTDCPDTHSVWKGCRAWAQGSLRLWGSHYCGASLLNRRWVLSAAHCFQKHIYPYEWSVQFGELSVTPPIWSLRAYLHRYRVKSIIIYPKSRNYLQDDSSLLKLSSSVTFNKNIQPVCVLSSSSEFKNRDDCWVNGWGDIHEKKNLPPPYDLQEVQVSIINKSRCSYLFHQPDYSSHSSNNMICPGSEDGNTDACKGDPGRPLVCEKNGPWIQIGIVSWGVGCGRRNQAGIYTNVSSYFNWIQMLVGHSTPKPDPSQLLLPLALLWAP